MTNLKSVELASGMLPESLFATNQFNSFNGQLRWLSHGMAAVDQVNAFATFRGRSLGNARTFDDTNEGGVNLAGHISGNARGNECKSIHGLFRRGAQLGYLIR